MVPFLWIGFNCLKAKEPLKGDNLLFYHSVPRSSWYSIGLNTELSLEPPSDFEPGTPELGLQRLKY